jgi:hypothetical protein
MAVTINSNPKPYVLSDNPIMWVFSSDQTAQANFSYIVELYINSTLHSTHRVFPTNGIYANFDAKKYVSINTPSPRVDNPAPSQDAFNNVTAYIIVRENYGNPPTNQANATSSTVTAWKGKYNQQDWVLIDTDDYVFTNNNSLWLTEAPRLKVRQGEILNIYHITNNDANVERIIRFFTASGSTVGSAHFIYPAALKVTRFNMSYDYLEAQCTGDFSTVAYVTVDVSSTTPLTGVRLFIDIDRTCATYTTRLHFLNQLGGMDAFTFTRLNRKTTSTEVRTYQTQQGVLTGSTYQYSPFYTGTNNFQVTFDKTQELVSGWVTADVSNWLYNNLMTSPYVIYEQMTDKGTLMHRVGITSVEVVERKQYVDTLTEVRLSIVLLSDTSAIV